MRPTLVLQPSVPFTLIGQSLSQLGWTRGRDTSVAPPLVEGEPEFASWSREAGAGRASISYTFNPVVYLRVLVFYGERAEAERDEVSGALPTLGDADLRRLLQSDDPRTLLLGVLAARELRAFETLDLLKALRGHAHATVATAAQKAHDDIAVGLFEAGAARLRDEKQKHPERSALFPHLGDAHLRRQTLRWLMRDYREANEHILEVLRSGLVDEDWEVRATAMLAAVRLRARSLGSDVRRSPLPPTSREGPDEADRSIFFIARKVALAALAGEREPDDAATKRDEQAALSRHVWRCVTGQAVERHDRAFLFINALAEPLEIEDETPPALDCVAGEDGEYKLRRTDVELCLVARLPHWLGSDDRDLVLPNPVRRVAPPAGFFIARRPLSVAEARSLDPRLAAVGNSTTNDASQGDRAYLCGRAEAARLCELLSRMEGCGVRLPHADEWEMAARGTDGRRYPWGNGYEGDPRSLSSPWGLEQMAGLGPEWTGTLIADGGRVLCGGVEDLRCAARTIATHDDASTLAAVRPVIES